MPKAKGKLKLEPITNKSERNQTFSKRKRGLIKKVSELATLCGVKACAVIKRCDKTEPEFWPSREEAQAVHSDFKSVMEKRIKKMYNQERYLNERIQKEGEKVMKLDAENRETEVREAMFDLLKGKMLSPHLYYDANFIGQLNFLIGGYVNKLNHRIRFLEASGGSIPPNVDVADAYGPVVGDVNHVVIGSEGLVSNPTEVYDHRPQYDGMHMSVNGQAFGGSNVNFHHQNMNHQEALQYLTPGNLYDQTQPRFYGSNQVMNMNPQEPYQNPTNFYDQTQPMFYGSSQDMNMNYPQELFHYQNPPNFYDQTQPRFYGSSDDMNGCLSHDQGQSSNQYPNQQQSFMSMLMGQPQQMSDVQNLASVPSMDDNNNHYHQLPVTSQIPLTTTTTTAAAATDLSGHTINNKRWPTRFGLD